MTPQLVDIIKINKLTKKFGKVLALDEFDMSVRQVEVHGFLRPNGSSENTTIHILLGLLKSTGCQMYLFGGDTWRDAVELHSKLDYGPGDVNFWPNLTGGAQQRRTAVRARRTDERS